MSAMMAQAEFFPTLNLSTAATDGVSATSWQSRFYPYPFEGDAVITDLALPRIERGPGVVVERARNSIMELTPYGVKCIYWRVSWEVIFSSDFDPEYRKLPATVQDELLAQLTVLERFGPDAGRPRVDTLKGSKHANMKELPFDAADGVWRFAFAFDPKRRAAVLVGGDKSGISEKRFYRQLVSKADQRFDAHLSEIAAERKPAQKKAERKKR